MKPFRRRLALASFSALLLTAAAQAQPESTPLPQNAHGALVGPRTANALQPPDGLEESPRGPFKPLSDRLAARGISLRGVLIDQYANNPQGGVRQGDDNVGQLNFGADVNLQKLLGIPGGSLHSTVYRDYGDSLSKDDTGTFVKQQSIYRNPYNRLRLGTFAYEQKLLNGKLDVFVGRLGATLFYGHLLPACGFQSGATCGVPAVLNSETGFSQPLSATWGSDVVYHLSSDIYFESGAFEVNPKTANTSGLVWSTKFATGVTAPFELSWSRPSLKTEAYPFELKGGGYVSTAPHADPFYNTKGRSIGLYGGKALSDATRDGLYVMGDRVIWRPDRASSENLNLFGGVVHPLKAEEIMREEVYAGLLLTGAIPHRPRDSIGLAATYFQLSPREVEFLRDSRIKAGGTGSNPADQAVFELNYGWQAIRNLRLTPNIQYVINPDNANIPKTNVLPGNILVIGLSLNMGFSRLLGFAGVNSTEGL